MQHRREINAGQKQARTLREDGGKRKTCVLQVGYELRIDVAMLDSADG